MSGPILVFGARSQVGREIVSLAAARGLPVVGLSRVEATERPARRACSCRFRNQMGLHELLVQRNAEPRSIEV